MKNLKILPIVAALGIVAAAPAFAEGVKGHDGPPAPHKMIERLDTDKDGTVSRAEFDAKGDEMFSKLDTDKDGKVSKEEFEAAHKRHAEKRKEWKEKRAAEKKGD